MHGLSLIGASRSYSLVVVWGASYCSGFILLGLPWWLSGKENLPAMQEPQKMWVPPLSWEDPLEEGMATHSSVLAWRSP